MHGLLLTQLLNLMNTRKVTRKLITSMKVATRSTKKRGTMNGMNGRIRKMVNGTRNPSLLNLNLEFKLKPSLL